MVKQRQEKNFCLGDRERKNLFSFKVALHKIMPLILVLIASILTPFGSAHAQPTENLEAKYYNTHNASTSFGNFGGTVIETRTWEKIDTTNYNPQGRGDFWSVAIEGYILRSKGHVRLYNDKTCLYLKPPAVA